MLSCLMTQEPTSGLDSYTATCLMQMLKEYALRSKVSVVVAVHQPSSKIFHLFNVLLLLFEGQVRTDGNWKYMDTAIWITEIRTEIFGWFFLDAEKSG